MRVNFSFFHTAVRHSVTLFWLFIQKVQKLRIFRFGISYSKLIFPLPLHFRNPKNQPQITSFPISLPVELCKVRQFFIFGKTVNFYLVQGSKKMPVPSKIAVYRGNQPFHVKIWKILPNKHV